MTRSHPTADRGTYIGLSRGQQNSPQGASEVLGGFPVPAAGHEMRRNRGCAAYPRTGSRGTPLGSGVTVGGDESWNRRSNSYHGARLDIPLASHERLTADGDRISVRQISQEA